MVLAHARALLSSSPEGRCAYIDADIRDPEKILNAAAEVLDLTEPVAVVLMAVLQFVPDEDDPHEIVRRLLDGRARGQLPGDLPSRRRHSGGGDGGHGDQAEPARWRSASSRAAKDEVTAFFDGLDLVEPGVIRCPEWRPDRPEDAAGKSTMWGGVGAKLTNALAYVEFSVSHPNRPSLAYDRIFGITNE